MKIFLKWLKSLFGFGDPKPEPFPAPKNDPVPDPTPLPPTPIDWASMTCLEMKARISEIEQLLLTSKFGESIRVYWESELTKGLKIYSKKCDKFPTL